MAITQESTEYSLRVVWQAPKMPDGSHVGIAVVDGGPSDGQPVLYYQDAEVRTGNMWDLDEQAVLEIIGGLCTAIGWSPSQLVQQIAILTSAGILLDIFTQALVELDKDKDKDDGVSP